MREELSPLVIYWRKKDKLAVSNFTYSTSRCYEVQEPHPQPPHRLRGGGLGCTS